MEINKEIARVGHLFIKKENAIDHVFRKQTQLVQDLDLPMFSPNFIFLMSLDQFNASELQVIGGTLGSVDPKNVGNRADVEMQWAIKAYGHAETYDNLLKSVNPQFLKLTAIDDEIYRTFRQAFPDTRLDVLDLEEMKSAEGKKKWREYCNQFENRVENFNMGTLLRVDSSQEFSEQNSTLAVRIQFLAIEIARNREGHNNSMKKTITDKHSATAS